MLPWFGLEFLHSLILVDRTKARYSVDCQSSVCCAYVPAIASTEEISWMAIFAVTIEEEPNGLVYDL